MKLYSNRLDIKVIASCLCTRWFKYDRDWFFFKPIITKHLLAHVSLQRTPLRCQHNFSNVLEASWCPFQKRLVVGGVSTPEQSGWRPTIMRFILHALSALSEELTLLKHTGPWETLFPILLLESVVNFSGRDVFSNEEFDHNALFHAPRYLLFAHHSSNSQSGLNRF